jgi:hypothetical protein
MIIKKSPSYLPAIAMIILDGECGECGVFAIAYDNHTALAEMLPHCC